MFDISPHIVFIFNKSYPNYFGILTSESISGFYSMDLAPTRGNIYYPDVASIVITGNTVRWYVGRSYFLAFSIGDFEISSKSSTSSPVLQLNESGAEYNYLTL